MSVNTRVYRVLATILDQEGDRMDWMSPLDASFLHIEDR